MDSLHDAARRWVGTPFVHQGRSSPGGAGVDCLGLLIGAARFAGVTSRSGRPFVELDETGYGRYPDVRHLRAQLDRALIPLEPDAALSCGQIALLRIDRREQHLGVIGTIAEDGMLVPTLIHAHAPVGKVVEHRLDETWKRRLVARYIAPG